MVVKGDQEKIRTLLKDTITLLCKNGLAYNLQFSVEALIGITLDKDDVFLVSINETVRSAAAALEKADQHSPDVDLGVDPPEGASDGDGEVSLDGGMAYGNNDHSKRMKHTRRKRRYDESEMAHPSETDPGGGGDYDDSSLGGLPDDSSAATSLDAPPTKARFKQPKMEDSDSDRKDVVVIKEEADDDEDDWTIQSDMSHGSYGVPVSLSEQQQAQQQHHSAVDDADLSQVLQSGSLVPVSVQHGHAQSWANQQQRQSSTVTGDLAQGDSSDNQQMPSSGLNLSADQRVMLDRLPASNAGPCPVCHAFKGRLREHVLVCHMRVYRYKCPYCDHGFSTTSGLRGHVSKHTGVKAFRCPICQRGYQYKKDIQLHMERIHPGAFAAADMTSSSPSFTAGPRATAADMTSSESSSPLFGAGETQPATPRSMTGYPCDLTSPVNLVKNTQL